MLLVCRRFSVLIHHKNKIQFSNLKKWPSVFKTSTPTFLILYGTMDNVCITVSQTVY